MKNSQKSFYRGVSHKRKIWEDVGPQLNGAQDRVSKDTEKAKVLNAFFTGKISRQESQDADTSGKVWSPED